MKVLLLLFFSILYFFPIDIGIGIKTSRFLGLLLCFAGIWFVSLSRAYIIFVLGFFAALFTLLILNGGSDLTLAILFFDMLVIMPLSCLFLYSVLDRYAEPLRIVLLTVFSQATMVILMSESQLIRDTYLSFIVVPPAAEIFTYRSLGFTGFTSYNQGVFLTMGTLAGLLAYKNNLISTRHLILFSSINFLAAFLASRSGLLILPFALLFALYVFEKRGELTRLLFSLFLLIGVLTGIVLNNFDEERLAWAFVLFISIIQGDLPIDVTGIFSTEYFLPDFKTLLVGDGIYLDKDSGGFYRGVDPGYMRLILYFGILGTTILFSVIIMIFLGLVPKVKRSDLFFFELSLLVIFIMMLKGNFFIDGQETLKLLLVCYLFCRNVKLFDRGNHSTSFQNLRYLNARDLRRNYP